MEKKKSNLKNIIICVLILLLGLSLVYIGYIKLNNKDKKENNYVLNVLKSDIFCDSNIDNNCSDVVYTIKTETENAKVLDATDRFVLYEDVELKIFDNQTKQIKNISLENDYEYYQLHISIDKNNVIGVIGKSFVSDNKTFKSVYYNLSLDKKMYENKYYEINTRNDEFLDAYSDYYPIGNHSILYANKEEEFMSGGYLYFQQTADSYYIVDHHLYIYAAIYSNDKKLIVKNIDYKNVAFTESNLYILNNNIVKKYDTTGEVVETITKYKNILGFINGDKDYVVYIENSVLKLQDLETKQVISIANWNSKYELTNFSVYLKDENKICIALREKGKLDNNGNELVGIEYYYNLNTKEITTKQKNGGFTYQAWD